MSKAEVQAYYKRCDQSGQSYLRRRFESAGGQLVSEQELKPFRQWIHLNEGQQLLDLGSGTGRVLSTLPRDVWCQATALDSSEPMLEHLRKHFPEVDVRLGDLFEYEPEVSFDFVTALRVLDHFSLTQQQSILTRLKSFLSPNGRIMVAVVVGPTLESLANRFSKYRNMTFFHSRSAYARMFHRCGLQVSRRYEVFLLPRGVYYRLPKPLAQATMAIDVGLGRLMRSVCSYMTCELIREGEVGAKRKSATAGSC